MTIGQRFTTWANTTVPSLNSYSALSDYLSFGLSYPRALLSQELLEEATKILGEGFHVTFPAIAEIRKVAPKGNQGLHEFSSNQGSSNGGSLKKRQLKASWLLGHYAAFFIGEPSPLGGSSCPKRNGFLSGIKKATTKGWWIPLL